MIDDQTGCKKEWPVATRTNGPRLAALDLQRLEHQSQKIRQSAAASKLGNNVKAQVHTQSLA